MSVRQAGHRGFANPVDPRPDELWSWAYHPETVPFEVMPRDWDLLVAGDTLAPTLFELAMDRQCPVRRFALHCLYIYAGESVRPNATAQRKRRIEKFVQRAEDIGDEPMAVWAHNTRMLTSHPELFDHADWIEGGLARYPRRLSLLRRR
jgi:hypothetical protein